MQTSLATQDDVILDDPGQDPESEFEEIIYHVTHDVRATLRAMVLLPEWIDEELSNHDAKARDAVVEYLDMLKAQGRRADQMMIDLRSYSRVGRMADADAPIEMSEAIRIAVRDAQVPEPFHVSTDLEIARIIAPRNDFTTFLTALISNAVKHHHAPAGRIHIASRHAVDGFTVSVEDDGPGTPAEFRERVFKLLTTLKSRDECEGSGIGLAVARKVIRTMGGTLWMVDADQLGGTCVLAKLPRARIAP